MKIMRNGHLHLMRNTMGLHTNLDEKSLARFKKKLPILLKSLTFKEEIVLKMRFGLRNQESYLLKEVGEFLKISKNRVRSIEAKALWKTKKRLSELGWI